MSKFELLKNEEFSVRERKRALREYMKEKRGEIVNRDVKEERLMENFFELLNEAGKKDARVFFVYASYSSEARTDKLIEALERAGKTVYCPRIEGGEMLAVELGDDFTLSAFGTLEPVGEPYEGKIDVCVVPLLAVDKKGNRLGYGKGFYDRFLAARNTLSVGYCFDVQVLNDVPTEEGDIPLQAVATENKRFFCGEEIKGSGK